MPSAAGPIRTKGAREGAWKLAGPQGRKAVRERRGVTPGARWSDRSALALSGLSSADRENLISKRYLSATLPQDR